MALFRRKRRTIRRLLIVEDEPLVAFDNEHALSAAGYRVVATVDRGEAAMPWLTAEQIDAALLDVRIAGAVVGIALARIAVERHIPILFVTGDCPPEAKALAFGCIAKPYAAADLVAAIACLDSLLQGGQPDNPPLPLTLFREAVPSRA